MGWASFLGGGKCGPPYTESQDHEFEGDSGMAPGGVNQAGYCKHCGVQQSYHGGQSGAGGRTPGGGGGQESGAQGGGRPGGAWSGGQGFGR